MPREPLVNSEGMLCPRCNERQDILAFTRLHCPEEWEHLLEAIYKCKKCRFVFAPANELVYNYFDV